MTVERARLVEWWPLVDVGRIPLQPGDTVILRTTAKLPADTRRRLREAWEQTFPGVKAIFAADIDFIVWKPMREMRAEDLVQPERKTTME